MPEHEYFEELCALLPIGQLSIDQWKELADHLRGCTSCRNARDEFSIILETMPVGEMGFDERVLPTLQDDSYRTRFIQRSFVEGVPFSDAVMRPRVKTSFGPRFRLLPAFSVAVVTIVVGLSIQVFMLSKERSESRVKPPTQRLQTPAALTKSQGEQLITELQAKIKTLENQAMQEGPVLSQLKVKLSESRAESHTATERLAATIEQLGDTQRRLDVAREDLRRLQSEKESADAELVDQQFKITELTAHITEKDALADRERQLNAVTRDVRDLMGARNLHILDVSDVDGNGRSRKTFGRVFFVEEKSLIFYAFDLGDRANPAKVSFQAWAQVEGRGNIAKNLGVFHVDDHAQKRWVLKVSDPERLRAVNSFFVTIEPLGGNVRPTGKKLLYAYVGTQANHP
jgi:hypothetical protein